MPWPGSERNSPSQRLHPPAQGAVLPVAQVQVGRAFGGVGPGQPAAAAAAPVQGEQPGPGQRGVQVHGGVHVQEGVVAEHHERRAGPAVGPQCRLQDAAQAAVLLLQGPPDRRALEALPMAHGVQVQQVDQQQVGAPGARQVRGGRRGEVVQVVAVQAAQQRAVASQHVQEEQRGAGAKRAPGQAHLPAPGQDLRQHPALAGAAGGGPEQRGAGKAGFPGPVVQGGQAQRVPVPEPLRPLASGLEAAVGQDAVPGRGTPRSARWRAGRRSGWGRCRAPCGKGPPAAAGCGRRAGRLPPIDRRRPSRPGKRPPAAGRLCCPPSFCSPPDAPGANCRPGAAVQARLDPAGRGR